MANIVQEPEDLAFVLIPPASLLDVVGQAEYSESELNPNSSNLLLPGV